MSGTAQSEHRVRLPTNESTEDVNVSSPAVQVTWLDTLLAPRRPFLARIFGIRQRSYPWSYLIWCSFGYIHCAFGALWGNFHGHVGQPGKLNYPPFNPFFIPLNILIYSIILVMNERRSFALVVSLLRQKTTLISRYRAHIFSVF